MNKRILELATQAGLYSDWNGKPWPRGMSCDECDEAYARFAELIVNTCIDLLEHDARDIHPRSHDYCISLIKEHFGVEE